MVVWVGLHCVGSSRLVLARNHYRDFERVFAGCIILYDAVHKQISFAPVLMGACRFLLYLVAASSCSQSINGWAVWCGLALACYIIGLSYLARRESTAGALQYWPLLFLTAPILIAFDHER